MAINIPIVTEFDAKGLQSAQNAFSNFKTKIDEADGAFGKMKAGGTAAFDAIKANAGKMAAAAGAAITAFAVKGMNDFVDLALAAGKFADATGLAVEDASRWIEVSGDFGVEAATVEKAINKMNVAISAQKKEFGALGAQVVYTKDGLIDVNATFLNTIDKLKAIPNAAERARMGAAVLGKGWMDMAEIVQLGSEKLTSALGSVSNAKVINPEELQKAKDFRAAMDRMGDAFQDLAITLGTILVPAMILFNNTVGKVLGGVANLFGGTSELEQKVIDLAAAAKEDAVSSLKLLQGAFYTNYVRAGELRYRALQLGEALNVLDSDTNGLIDTWDALLFKFNQEEAWNNLMGKLAEYKNAAVEAFAKRTPEAIAQSEQATRDLVRGIAQITSEAKIAAQTQIKILAMIDKGQFDQALALIQQELARGLQVPILPVPATAYNPPKPGTSTPGGTIQNPLIPGKINTYNLVGGGQSTPSVVVNVAGSVQTENDLLESIRQGLVNAQRSGKGLIYSNTSTY